MITPDELDILRKPEVQAYIRNDPKGRKRSIPIFRFPLAVQR